MPRKWIRWIGAAIVVALIVAAAVYALMPRPIAVDVATIAAGPMQVTIDEEGTARIRDVFRVSAPISGRLDRLPVHLGDRVFANVTEVATLRPAEPGFLDARTRAELESAVQASQASVALAEAQVAAATASLRVAESDLERSKTLAKVGAISLRAFEQATAAVDTANAGVKQAEAQMELRKSELASAKARLIEPDVTAMGSDPSDSCCLVVRAPVSGVVLKIISQSEQVVAAGTQLLEIGDPKDMEVVVPLLSSDAATIAPGTPATIGGWGGPDLAAEVKRIDPAAYTKVSALGIEEQRVDATLALTDPYEKRQQLGHGFRVQASIAIWRTDNAVQVPLGALFRLGSDWAVYRVVDGRAATTAIGIDRRNNQFAAVTGGLSAGDVVILHPSDRIADGVAVETR